MAGAVPAGAAPTVTPLPIDASLAGLVQAAARALPASAFLRRSLEAEGIAPPAVPADGRPDGQAAGQADLQPGAADARWPAWLLDVGASAWSAERIRAQYLRERHRLADDPAPGRAGEDAALRDAAALRDVARALRRCRRRLLCGLLLRDCAGWAPVEEITASMTEFAQLAVRELLAVLAPALARRHGVPVDAGGVPQDLLVLGMGKAGTFELNVSSDLDLIFVYGEVRALRLPVAATVDAAGAPAPARRDPLDGQQFFEQLGRQLIAALDERDADGFVFRIDMRLRPHGDAGPLAVGTAMLEEYLVREGREWERFAWAKARVISAPVLASAAQFAAQCAALDALVEPFVYRKYFDFGAIGAIRDLHQRIRADATRRAGRRAGGAGRPGMDIKLGRGGIREIEFLAQTFCIMRGGRDPRLRGHGTVATLQILCRLGLLGADEARALIDHYRFLRRLEHALQYRDDAQTHALPDDDAALAALARLLGMDDGAQVLAAYRAASAGVARRFDAMFPPDAAGAAETLAQGARALDADALESFGLADPGAGAQRLRQLLASPRFAQMPAPARAAVEQLAYQALQIIRTLRRADPADTSLPLVTVSADEMLLRWIRLVEVIGRRSTYLSLLAEYPRAHERLMRLLAAGGWPTQFLLEHPILLDELIDPRTDTFGGHAQLDDADVPPGAADAYWQPWIDEIDELLASCAADVERQMNLLRDAHHAQVFRLLLADLAGSLRLEQLADHLSALADAVLTLTLRAVWRHLSISLRADGALPGAAGDPPPLAIVAYGKLGGRELGYASDLDLSFVYGASADPDAADREAKLCTTIARRMISWLTTVTSSGTLFEIDLRLRPDGNAGLLVTPIEAFERYQLGADGRGAWVWEHQALTRARFCTGDAAVGRRIESIRAQVLARARDPAPLAAEVVAMRLRMLEGHVNRTVDFDLKHDRGGMVDIEFAVQFLVLAHAHAHDELLANRGNIALLLICAGIGLIDPELATTCAAAYRRYRRLQHALRLNGMEHARVDPATVEEEIEAVRRLWRQVFQTDDPKPPPRQRSPADRTS